MTADPPSLPVDARVVWGDLSMIRALAGEWRAMLAGTPWNEPFYQPEWILSYLEAFEPRADVAIVEARCDGHLVGVLPLVRDRLGAPPASLTRLRSASNVHSCRFDLIIGAGGDAQAVASAVQGALAHSGQWTEVRIADSPDHGAAHRLAAAARASGWPTGRKVSLHSPVIHFPPAPTDWETFSHGLSSRFRGSLRQWRRRLEARGTVTVLRYSQADPDVLQRFYALERAGWKGARGTAIDCSPETRRFYDLIAHHMAERGILRLYELRAGDATVAMQYGLVLGGVYYMPKLAHDERLRDCAPGHLLMEEVIRDCLTSGLATFDCLGDADEYKLRWTSETRAHASMYLFAPDLTGRAAHALEFPARRVARYAVAGTAKLMALLGFAGHL